MTQAPEKIEIDGPETAHEQRAQMARPNRNIALLLFGGVFFMLAAAFCVALLVIYGGF